MVVQFKACPKCHGDMQVNGDIYGQYIKCLQCGYMLDLQQPVSKFPAWSRAGKKRTRRPKAA